MRHCPICATALVCRRLRSAAREELDLIRDWIAHHPWVSHPIKTAGIVMHFMYFTAIAVGMKDIYVLAAGALAVLVIAMAVMGEEH